MFPNLSRVSAMWGFLALDNYSRVSCCKFPAYDCLTKLLLLRAKSNMLCKKLQKLALLNPQLYKLKDGLWH
ncbi:hypothetical protein QYF36_015779 [Acer negundo]|nr:hypothetical protein QYF36_015779 [Acer negundo]